MVGFSLYCVTENVHVRLGNSLVESVCHLQVSSMKHNLPHYILTTLSWIRIEDVGLKIFILAWEFVTRRCLKAQNPCSNHEIYVLFEYGFYLKRHKLCPDLYA